MRIVPFLVFTFLQLFAFSQLDLEAPLENCHFDKELIVKYGIKSVSVFSEMDENGFDGNSTYSGKLSEYEFDSNGNTIYKLTASNGGNAPFLFYDRGSRPEYMEYDERGLLVYRCMEDLRELKELYYEFDEDENLTMERVVLKNKNYADWDYKRSFEWKNGEMIKTVDVNETEMPGSEITFDKNGHVAQIEYGNARTTYRYRQQGDKLITRRVDYENDTLVSKIYLSHFVYDEDRIVRNSIENHKGEVVVELNMQYDDFGNITNHRSQSVSGNYREYGEPAESVTSETQMINKYDERGFLMKQYFYSSSYYSPEKKLVQVNHYCYETVPLVFKVEKGAISRNQLEKEPMSDH